MLAINNTTVVKLNPLLRVRFGERPAIDLLLEGDTVALPELRYVKLLPSLTQPRKIDSMKEVVEGELECAPTEASQIVEAMVKAKVLVQDDYASDKMPAIKHWVDRGWLEGLVLHLSTRDLSYYDEQSEEPNVATSAEFAELIKAEGPPSFWKEYPEQPGVQLPPATKSPFTNESLEEVLLRRRSNRPFKKKSISLDAFSTLMASANKTGLRIRRETEAEYPQKPHVLLRSAFTSLETYVYAFGVEGLEPGLYHYDLRQHRMVLLRSEITRDEVASMCIGQGWARNGAFTLLITAVWERYMFRYRHGRAYRNLLVNCAELAQKYIVLATALGLNTFLTPNTLPSETGPALELDEWDEAVLYAVSAG